MITTRNRFWRNRSRWSDNDRYWGPFLYSRVNSSRRFAVELSSGCDEYPGCTLRLSGSTHTLIVALPPMIKPLRVKKSGYVDIQRCEYGFSYAEGFLLFRFGPQTWDSSTTKSKGYFLPWTQWRHVRHSLYGLNGEHFWTAPKAKSGDGFRAYEAVHGAREQCASKTFAFTDFDGERLTVKTWIEEREWLFGTGWFKWLSIFRHPKVSRSLELAFSDETGRRKGSWKGGTLGTSIKMLPGELHEGAFRRYCAENEMTFLELASAEPQGAA